MKTSLTDASLARRGAALLLVSLPLVLTACTGPTDDSVELVSVWTVPISGTPGAPLVTAGLTIIADDGGNVRAVDFQDGTERWMASTGGVSVGAPVADAERVFLVTEEGVVEAFALGTGELLWSASLANGVTAGLALDGSRLFASETEGTVTAFATATGEVLWSVALAGSIWVTPGASSAAVIIASSSGDVTRLDPATGDVLWQVQPDPTYIIGTPLLTDTMVVLPGYEDTVLGLSLADGATLWSEYGGNYLVALPTLSGDTVCFGTAQGPIRAVSATEGEALWVAPDILYGRQAILIPASTDLLVVDMGGVVTRIDSLDGIVRDASDLGFEIAAATTGSDDSLVLVADDTLHRLRFEP